MMAIEVLQQMILLPILLIKILEFVDASVYLDHQTTLTINFNSNLKQKKPTHLSQ